MSVNLIALAIALAAASGVPGLFAPRGSALGQRLAVALVCVSSLAGLAGACLGLFLPFEGPYILPWQAAGGSFIGVDALSAFFLVPVFVVGGLGSVYSLGYWPQRRRARTAPKLQFFWGTLMAGMALLVVGRQAMAFLLGWETMALSAFFLVSTEDDKAECRRGGLVYLVATHAGTLFLFGVFALWKRLTGSFDLEPMRAGAASTLSLNALFFGSLVGFGMKAGFMPLHFWLPGAHANAPSHVSAMLSGVMLKMGIYGLVRMLSLLPGPPPLWGGIVLLLGAVSGVGGVLFAIAQHDLKRLLAYHSVENVGIILMGLGLAMMGKSYGRPDLVVLGLGGCLLHVWNHSLFKSLLFMGAGSVLHATGTRRIDRLGGLAKRMPWTAALFLVGAVAICGLPPLNGFVSEFLVYTSLFRSLDMPGLSGSFALAAAPALAMIGALAVACFVKVYGAVFLGSPRTESALRAREAGAPMVAPMVALAALCAFIGLAPALVSPVLDGAIAAWMASAGGAAAEAAARTPAVSATALGSLAPLGAVGLAAAGLLLAAAPLSLLLGCWRKARRGVGTWDCGYAKPDPRMQYTASSFARTLVGLFGWILRPKTEGPRVEGVFPKPGSIESHVDEVVLDRALYPAFASFRRFCGWFFRFQQGRTQNYVLLIFIALILMLLTLVPLKILLPGVFAGGGGP